MKHYGDHVEDLKITYVGGGSRGWAWKFMSDLATMGDVSGCVDLYDIDYQAAKNNEIIGNKYNEAEGANTHWNYRAVESIDEALSGADFVIISILPATFDEMESDVHWPEKYGTYQTVGDTTGPGGVLRAMRTLPMYAYIAEKIRENCPDAWVISYTNPMALCVKQLYDTFPKIKAYGCCHEVFNTQNFLVEVAEDKFGVTGLTRDDIKTNPVGVNHYTWFTEAHYKNNDLFPVYKEFCENHPDGYRSRKLQKAGKSFENDFFASDELVKMTLFMRFGYIAAAGDRHLAEFCPAGWFLENDERVKEMHFARTPVSWRKADLENRLKNSAAYVSGEKKVEIGETGEEGTRQIRAILGLSDLVTNVNLPNRGQIPNLPYGAIVETNAVFRGGSVMPVLAGPIPETISPMIERVCHEEELIFEGIKTRDVNKIFAAFVNDPLITCGYEDAKKMFREMCENTKAWLSMYDLDALK